MNEWTVYLLICRDSSYYCGITKNLEKRIDLHNLGIASKYTRSRRLVKLLCNTHKMTKSEALKLEYKIKQLPKNEKINYLNNYQANNDN